MGGACACARAPCVHVLTHCRQGTLLQPPLVLYSSVLPSSLPAIAATPRFAATASRGPIACAAELDSHFCR